MASPFMGAFSGAIGGTAIGSAVVRLVLDTRQYEGELAAAEGQTAKATQGMGVSSSKFGTYATAAFLVAGAAAVKFAESAVKSASAEGEALNKAKVIFGDFADSVIAFSDTSAAKLGISKTAALDTSASFGAMFQTAGIAGQAAADMSLKMVQLAADMASFNNQDPSEMLKRLQSGLAGQARPLRQFGVFLSDAAITEVAYRDGIAKTGAALTDAQKVQARYNLILEQTTKQQGDFARTVGYSLPNQMRVLSASVDDLKAKIGTALLPAINDIMRAMVQLVQDAGPLLTGVFQLLADVAQSAADSIGDFASKIGWLLQLFPQTSGEADKTGVSLGGLAKAFIDLANLPDQFIHPIGRWQQAWRDATGQVDTHGQALGEVGAAIFGLAQPIALSNEALQKLADEHKAAAQAARDQKSAELSLSGGLLGLVSNLKSVRDAQATVNDLKKQGKTGTQEYKDAVLAELQAIQTFKSSLVDYGKKLHDAGLSQEDVKAKLITMGKQFGLAKSDIQGVIDKMDKWAQDAPGAGKRAAQGLAQGFIGGLVAAKPPIIATINSTFGAATDAMNKALGNSSPSRIARKSGIDFVQGLIDGLLSKDSDLQSAAQKIADSLTKALNRSLREAQKALSDAQAKLSAAQAKAQSFQGTVGSSFGSFLDISGGLWATSGAEISSFFGSQLAGAQQWASVLQALQAQGLSKELLAQIAQQGPSALGFAQQLLQMGPAGIAQINQTYGTILDIAGATSKGLTEDYFGSKIDELKGGVAEVRDEIKLLNQAIREIGKMKKLELDIRPGGEAALRQLILSVIREASLARAGL